MNKASAYASGVDTGAPRRITLKVLREHCAAVLRAAGLGADAALLVADSLVDAESRGISSHGVTRTRIYAERLREGMLDATADPVVVQDGAGGAHIDARNAIGHVGADRAADLAIERAQNNSAYTVGVSHSNHCGTLAYFTRRVARAGLVCLAMSTAPPTMVYFGGKSRAVGTNPLSIAVPRFNAEPIVMDMATSGTARGKIILANQLGQPIPDGWAVDVEGRPTVDPAAALEGSVVPFAGPKGSGMAMMVDLLAGGMVGGVTGQEIGDMYEDWTRPQRVGHLFIALDPGGWIGQAAFGELVANFAARVHDLPPADGFEQVLLPGEVEDRGRATAERDGVLVPAAVCDDLDSLAEEIGADERLPVSGL